MNANPASRLNDGRQGGKAVKQMMRAGLDSRRESRKGKSFGHDARFPHADTSLRVAAYTYLPRSTCNWSIVKAARNDSNTSRLASHGNRIWLDGRLTGMVMARRASHKCPSGMVQGSGQRVSTLGLMGREFSHCVPINCHFVPFGLAVSYGCGHAGRKKLENSPILSHSVPIADFRSGCAGKAPVFHSPH